VSPVWAGEKRYRSLLWLLVGIGLMNVLDYAATYDLVVRGNHREANPFMGFLIERQYFTLYKLAVVTVGLAFLWSVRRSMRPRHLTWLRFTCCIYVVLLLYTWIVFYFP